MKRLRSALTLAVAIVGTWAVTTATAQTGVPNYAYVRDSSGQDFVISGGQRIAVPIYPATDEQIAAIHWPGQWLGLKADGSGYENGPRPEWSAAATVPAPPPPVAGDNTIRLGADRGQNTQPFQLAAGNYTVRWQVQLQPTASSCYVGATLYRVEGKRRVEGLINTSISRDTGRSASGETQVYGVLAGAHYLDVSETGCSWSIEIRPQ